MKIIGYHFTEFTTKDGLTIKGMTLYTTLKPVSSGYYGLICEKIFLSENKLPTSDLKLGDEIEVYYNKFGKVQSVKIVS